MSIVKVDYDQTGLVFAFTQVTDVPDGFWLQLSARFRSDVRSSEERVLASVDELLSRRYWLGEICRRWDISLEWETGAADVVGKFVTLAAECQATIERAELSPDSKEDVLEALANSRFNGELRPFQIRDLEKLADLGHGANYSVPGAGKTAVTYALYEIERLRGRVDQLVVIAPLSAFGAWADEGGLWLSPAPLMGHFGDGRSDQMEMCITNYQRAANRFDDLARHMSRGATHLILDEAHRIKRGWTGEWGTACLRLAYLAERRDVLTGTPAPNRPRDLEPLIDFCWPGQSRVVLPEGVFQVNPPVQALSAVANRLSPFYVRTTKDELGLPPPNMEVVEVPAGELQGEIYSALRHRFAGRALMTRRQEVRLADMGRIIMYLLEAASNPALLAAGSSDDDPLSFRHPPLEIPDDSLLVDLIASYGRYETPPKFIEVAKIVENNRRQGKKTLIWSNFVRNLEWLANRVLPELNPAVIHGGVPVVSEVSVTRDEEIARFRQDGDCWVLLANPAAMAEGISLHRECNSAVYVDRTFNAGQFLQSQDRIHRLGLPAGVDTRITILMTVGTVDELVNRRVAEKVLALSALMQDAGLPEMTLPSEDDYGPPIENEIDLRELFAHLQGN
ncbi:MAG: DEAD/DEAH box helicase [bacterium]|nr:DEAD/DEAH box helicase [bacterium]